MVTKAEASSKTVATTWAKTKYSQWADLIQQADNWRYGGEMAPQDEVIEFIKFVVQEVEKIQI